MAADMTPLFETIVARCPAPDVDIDGALQLQVSQLMPSTAAPGSTCSSCWVPT
jgi:predicted membrane GTPase involved in stress response